MVGVANAVRRSINARINYSAYSGIAKNRPYNGTNPF